MPRKNPMSNATANKVQFSRAAKAGKLIRTAFERLLFNLGDPLMCVRLGAVMLQVVQTDEVHEHGYKVAGSGKLSLLNGFEFNQKKPLGKYLFAFPQYRLDRESGSCQFRFAPFNPEDVMRAPHWNSYFRLTLAAASFDFENETFFVDIQTSGYHSMLQPTDITLHAQLDTFL